MVEEIQSDPGPDLEKKRWSFALKKLFVYMIPALIVSLAAGGMFIALLYNYSQDMNECNNYWQEQLGQCSCINRPEPFIKEFMKPENASYNLTIPEIH